MELQAYKLGKVTLRALPETAFKMASDRPREIQSNQSRTKSNAGSLSKAVFNVAHHKYLWFRQNIVE